ncbi:unnamed protein product [Moneuplotes crassus]|uniref:Uncharacterized protein n=1 Tax=Euplotes crassus TaxID=5936 RepID=A0AAD2D3T8_EUPCR|nr:unnamed protein product [Moneuplotes crassus]
MANGYGHIDVLRTNSSLKMDTVVEHIDRNVKAIRPIIQSVRFIEESYFKLYIEVKNIVDLLNIILDLTLRIFHCDYLSCITPEVVIVKIFREFRNFSRDVITEILYGYVYLFTVYIKKEFGIITKIIEDKGLEIFTQNSDCIRMRIGQYYMQTFVGGNTSECSEFDQIIHSFSEQKVDERKNVFYLGFLILAIIFLCFLYKSIIKLIIQEYRTYKDLKLLENISPPTSSTSSNPIEIPNRSYPSHAPQSHNPLSSPSST